MIYRPPPAPRAQPAAGYHDGMNLNEYVGSRPYLTTDPSGMFQLSSDSTPSFYQFTIGGAKYTVPWDMRWIQFTMMNNSLSMQSIFAIAGLDGFCPVCNPPSQAGGSPSALHVYVVDSYKPPGVSGIFDFAIPTAKAAAQQWKAYKLPSYRPLTPGSVDYRRLHGAGTSGDIFTMPGNISSWTADLVKDSNETQGNCIASLEIDAHGWPDYTGGFDGSSGVIADLSQKTASGSIVWCSACQVWLSGCNTGVQPASNNSPIAGQFNGAKFAEATNEQCVVHATLGTTFGGYGLEFENMYTRHNTVYKSSKDSDTTADSYRAFSSP